MGYVKLDNRDEARVDGVFIILEHNSTSSILTDARVTTDEDGCILTDHKQNTNIQGVFAAGDCCYSGFQIVTAAGMGVIGAPNAMKYIKSMRLNV